MPTAIFGTIFMCEHQCETVKLKALGISQDMVLIWSTCSGTLHSLATHTPGGGIYVPAESPKLEEPSETLTCPNCNLYDKKGKHPQCF